MPGPENVNNYVRIFRKYLLSQWAKEEFDAEDVAGLTLKEITVNGPDGLLVNTMVLWGINHIECVFTMSDENGVIKLPVDDTTVPNDVKIDSIGLNEAVVDLSNATPVTITLSSAS